MIRANFGTNRYTGAGRVYDTPQQAADAMCDEYGESRQTVTQFSELASIKGRIEDRSDASIIIFEE
jgi:hypothetical protein